MRLLLLCIVLAPVAIAAEAIAIDVCATLRDPAKVAGKNVLVNGFIKPLMHGTYLKQPKCNGSILLVLPEEVPNYKGGIKVVKDAQFELFLDARFNHLPNAPVFFAEFVGQLEYAKGGKGFGYNKNHRTRLILQSVKNARSGPAGAGYEPAPAIPPENAKEP